MAWYGEALDRPLVIAHRGASGAAPENTLAAFRLALELGADGIELDVTRCASGEIVVLHDDTLERTTDGAGPVRAMPFAALRQLDAGAWFAEAYTGERVPLLAEVLDATGSQMLTNIEIKASDMRNDGLEAEVVEMVRQRGLQDRVIVSSFSPIALYRTKRAAPEIACGLLYAPHMPMILARGWARYWLKLEALHPQWTMVTPEYMRMARHRAYGVNVWTVNEPDDLNQVIALGVEGIITNWPDRALGLLGAKSPHKKERPL